MKNYNWNKNSIEFKAATKLQKGWGWLEDYQNDHNTLCILNDEELTNITTHLLIQRNKLTTLINKLIKDFTKETFFGIDTIIRGLIYINRLSENIALMLDEALFRTLKNININDTNSPNNSTDSSTSL